MKLPWNALADNFWPCNGHKCGCLMAWLSSWLLHFQSLYWVSSLSKVWQIHTIMFYSCLFVTLLKCFPLSFSTGDFDGFLLNDRWYSCTGDLMTSHPHPQRATQSCFNVAASKYRVRTDMNSGVIKFGFNRLCWSQITNQWWYLFFKFFYFILTIIQLQTHNVKGANILCLNLYN